MAMYAVWTFFLLLKKASFSLSLTGYLIEGNKTISLRKRGRSDET